MAVVNESESELELNKNVNQSKVLTFSEIVEDDQQDDMDNIDEHECIHDESVSSPVLSKRAQKRKIKFEAKKEFLKLKRKSKPSRPKKRQPLYSMKDSTCKLRVVIDCSFDDLMAEKDVSKLLNQISHCYGQNRRAPNPLQLYATDVNKKLLMKMKSVGEGNDYESWDMHWKFISYLNIFSKDSLVYLSSDSPTVLEHFDLDKVYIIGGLVDHNHHPQHCYHLAESLGIATAQLPISQHVKLNSRTVLTIDQVFSIILRYTETNDWKTTLETVIPKRKLLSGDTVP